MTSAARFAVDIFMDYFSYCMESNYEELEDEPNNYFILIVVQEYINVIYAVKNHIKVFIQWVSDDTRMGRNSMLILFPSVEGSNFIQR